LDRIQDQALADLQIALPHPESVIFV